MKRHPQIRELRQADCAAVTRIEASSFRDPWNQEDFEVALNRSDILAYVYTSPEDVLGYIIIQLEDSNAHIMNLAIHPKHRRQGIALECLDFAERLTRRLGSRRIDLEVQESNLAAQLLYRKAGYRATRILHNYYPDTEEDGYHMVRILAESANAVTRLK